MTPPTGSISDLTFRSHFAEAEWQRLLALGQSLEVPTGAVLLRRGDASSGLFLVERGAFEAVDPRTSPETVLEIVGEGQILGEMSYLDASPVAAEVRARRTSTCRHWARAALEAELSGDPALAAALFRALATTAVMRVRRVTTSAMIGGFGAVGFGAGGFGAGGFGAGGVGRDGEDLEETATTLAAGLRAAAVGTFRTKALPQKDPFPKDPAPKDPFPKDPAPKEGQPSVDFPDGLAEAVRWFARADDPCRAARVGERLRELLRADLLASPLAAAFLERPAAGAIDPSLFTRRSLPPPGFDRLLLSLPTLRGWRWRERAMVEWALRQNAASPGRILLLSRGAPSSSLLSSLSAHRSTVVDLGGGEPGPPPEGIRMERVKIEPLTFGRPSGPNVATGHQLALLDVPVDLLPDVLLRSIVAWCALHLAPQGHLLVAHAVPSPDVAFLEHFLRWPQLPRRSAALSALLPPRGTVDRLRPPDDAAARVAIWHPL